MIDLESQINLMQRRADELDRQLEVYRLRPVFDPRLGAELLKMANTRSDYLKLFAKWTLPMMRTT